MGVNFKKIAIEWKEINENSNEKIIWLTGNLPDKLNKLENDQYRSYSKYVDDIKNKYSIDQNIAEEIGERVIYNSEKREDIYSYCKGEFDFNIVKTYWECIKNQRLSDDIQQTVLEFFYGKQQEFYKNLLNPKQNSNQNVQENALEISIRFISELMENGLYIQERLLPKDSKTNKYVVVGYKMPEKKPCLITENGPTEEKPCFWTYTDGREFYHKFNEEKIILRPNNIEVCSEKYVIFEMLCSGVEETINLLNIAPNAVIEGKGTNFTWINYDVLSSLNDPELQKKLLEKMLEVFEKELLINWKDYKKTISGFIVDYRKHLNECIKDFLKEDKNTERTEIFKTILEKQIDMPRDLSNLNLEQEWKWEWEWEWDDVFYGLIDVYNKVYNADQDFIRRLNFIFSEDSLQKITDIRKDIFQKMPNDIQNRIFDKSKNLEYKEAVTIKEVLSERVYVRAKSEGNKSKYLYAKMKRNGSDELTPVIVVMGENSIRKVFREEFGYNGDFKPKSIRAMKSLPLDSDWEPLFDDVEDGIINLENVFQGENVKEFEDCMNDLEQNDDNFKYRLSNRFEIGSSCFKGYGKLKEEDISQCPICHSYLAAEMNSISKIYLSIKKDEEHSIVAPFLMCKNCEDAYYASINVYALQEKTEKELTEEYLQDNNKITVKFERNGKEKITFDSCLTVLHRKIIYDILKNEADKNKT